MLDSVRLRLTLWYVSVLALIVATFSIGVYIFLAHTLYDRLDEGLLSTLETVSSRLEDQDGSSQTREAAVRVIQGLHPSRHSIAVFDGQGYLLAEKVSNEQIHVRLPLAGLRSAGSTGFYSLPETDSESDDSCRGVIQHVRLPSTSDSYFIVVNQSLEPLSEQLESLQDILYAAVPLAVTLAGLGGWFLARRSLAPVVEMSEQAQRISVQNLDQQLPIANPRDELGRLAATFNELLGRLKHSFSQQQQFMADASHELRTPLSAIRTTSAVTLQRDREKSEYREALTIIEQQSRRLTRMVEDMFLLARADVQQLRLQLTSFYLDELLAETARAAAVLASQKNLQLKVTLLPEAFFHGDEALLRQMTWNLLDNAIKYTPQQGSVGIALESSDAGYVITVTDTGSGIAPEIQSHIFERFYRADKARSRPETADDGGAGLGLPIARWVAEAHHGWLELQRSDQTGSVFAVFLPRA